MEQSIPRNTEDNLSLPDGVYEAVIRRIVHRELIGFHHIVVVYLWLPHELTQFVAEINLPQHFDRDAHQQLESFCDSVGLAPEVILNTPSKFAGRNLRIKTRRCQRETSSGVDSFSRVVEFLSFGTPQQRNTELGMAMIPR